MHPRAREPHAVYRLFAADGTLLYVGCSVAPLTRLGVHTAGKLWAESISSVALEWFPDWEAAHNAECVAISSEHPEWNVRHKVGEKRHLWGKYASFVDRKNPETWVRKITGGQ